MSESMCPSESSKAKQIIIKILSDEKPKTVRKLSERAIELSKVDKNTIYNIIRQMERDGEIQLGSEKIQRKLPKTISQYLMNFNYYSIEFWSIITLTLFFFLAALLIPPNSPVFFLRVTMGIIFGIIVPGWTISNVIFPKLYETIDQIERSLIAIGINIGTMIFGGLILDQIWIIDSLPFVIVLGSLTIVAALISMILRILIGSGKMSLFHSKIKDRISKKVRKNEKSK